MEKIKRLLPKRWYTHVPIWVDYTVQIFSWLDSKISRAGLVLTFWRWDFLDSWCSCTACKRRREEDIQAPKRKSIWQG